MSNHVRVPTVLTVISLVVLSVTTPSAIAADTTTRPVQTQPAHNNAHLGKGDKAHDFTLRTLDDKPIRLSKLLAEGPVVLVVLRGWPGYQCPICTRQVGELIGKTDELKATKASVVLVYPGPADHLRDHAQEFISGKRIPTHFTFVTDPDFTFTKAYNLRWDAPKETAYPSTFVVDRQGVVRFAKVSKSHGDRASIADVLAALAEMK